MRRRLYNFESILVFIGVLALVFLPGLGALAYLQDKDSSSKDTTRRVRPPDRTPVDEKKPPDEDKVFVWSQPEKGQQSVLVLHVFAPVKGEDGKLVQQAEVALLVPTRIRLDIRDGWKPEALDKRLVGRMVTAEIRGRDASGRLQADLWLGKEGGGWLSTLKP